MIFKSQSVLALGIILLIAITLITPYYGSTDIGDYSDVAKYFAGDYAAKIRSSHSYLLGYLHVPFLAWMKSFFIFKITSLLFLAFLVYSVYVLSGRDKRALWLIVFSPVVWYMAPWINPIQLASIFLLWAYAFIVRYREEHAIRWLVYSGLLVGLGWAVWDTILYFGVILGLVFLYDRKISHGTFFIVAIILGLLPRLLLDQYLFGFPFYTTIKTFISGFVNLSGGIYSQAYGQTPHTLRTLLPFLLAIPVLFWRLYHPRFFSQEKRSMIFLSISLLLLLTNPQIRYLLALTPVMILIANKYTTPQLFKIHLWFSALILVLFVMPYALQIFFTMNHQIYGAEFSGVAQEGLSLTPGHLDRTLEDDLSLLAQEYPDKTFVVGNGPDDYQVLAHYYWGIHVKEFVSIQDYQLVLRNESVLYTKRFEPEPRIAERRQFWIEGGLKKNEHDNTDYKSIEYGLSLNEPLKLESFSVVKKYNLLYLSKKVKA